MNQISFSWPEGKKRAFTTSWDDGMAKDRRLVALHNTYGIKGTWNLNSCRLTEGNKDFVSAAEVLELYQGHEVAVHSATHPFLWHSPDAMIRAEIVADRLALEQMCRYPVTGMALPYGGADVSRIRNIAVGCGIEYIRSIADTAGFELPEDFLYWPPTAHQNADLQGLWERFLKEWIPAALFYLWGHSHEFGTEETWQRIEAFFKKVGGQSETWFATNMAIYQYAKAWRNLVCSLDMKSVRNDSGVTVWFRSNNQIYSLAPGAKACIAS